jgi:lysophosphatidate acyltransferase
LHKNNEDRLADGIAVLPPIPTTGLTAADADKLTQRTRDAMMNELMRLSHLRSYEDGAAVATGVDGGSEARRKVRAGL